MSKLESVQKSVIINHISINKLNTLIYLTISYFGCINQYMKFGYPKFAFKIRCFYPTVYGNVTRHVPHVLHSLTYLGQWKHPSLLELSLLTMLSLICVTLVDCDVESPGHGQGRLTQPRP